MDRRMYLVGGGPSAMLETRRHFKRALAALDKKRPLVAYLGAASGDNAAFRKMISLALMPARVEAANTVGRRAKLSATRALLDECDLVFVSGGDVHAGMQVLRERDLVEPLRALARAGKPMLGVSAGSIMLARDWVHFPDDDEARAELFECLAIAPVHIDCHSEDDGWSELRVLVRLLHERGEKPSCYGIPSRGALHIAADGTLSALGVALPRLAWRRGVVDDGALAPHA
jgi:peptidase E